MDIVDVCIVEREMSLNIPSVGRLDPVGWVNLMILSSRAPDTGAEEMRRGAAECRLDG
jgi:hypothetical protein